MDVEKYLSSFLLSISDLGGCYPYSGKARAHLQKERVMGGITACIPLLITKFPDQKRVVRTSRR